MDTDKLSPKQVWKAADGSQARVLRVFDDIGRRGSLTSMVGCRQVRYFNLRTQRQTTARAETFLSRFTSLVEEG